MNDAIYCDWLTVKQTHQADQPLVQGGMTEHFNESGELEFPVLKFKIFKGLHDTTFQIRSDGRTVEARGNIGKFNEPDNVHGISLDECKIKLNALLQKHNLAPFTDAKTVLLQGRKRATVISGATISRIDMMQNFATGSPHDRDQILRHLQTQNHPTLKTKSLMGLNTYYGRDASGKRSEYRLIRIYDKALELEKVQLRKKGCDQQHLKKQIETLNELGSFRIETEFHKYLKAHKLNLWQNATHANLCEHFQKDTKPMTEEIKIEDLEHIPNKLLGTLCMFLNGINPRERLSRNIYFSHKRELKKLGYDISSMENVERIKPTRHVISIRPLTKEDMPDIALPNPLKAI